MLTLPARVRRPLTRRALTALACIGALTLSSCAAHEEYSDSAPVTVSAATPTASVDAKTLFQTADGAWKANTVQIPLGLDAPATFDAVATPTAEPSTDAEYEAAFATSSAQTTDPGSRCGVTNLLGDSAGIYVYDGSDCTKAQETIRLFNNRKSQNGTASVEWYQCTTQVQGRAYVTAACFTQSGSTEKPRLAVIPATTRMLSGTLTFAEAYGGGTFGQGEQAKTVETLRFASADGKVACAIKPGGVDCQAMVPLTLPGWDAATGAPQQRVHLNKDTAEASLVGQTSSPEPVDTQKIMTLPIGQVVTAYGYTCKSVNTGKVHCVSSGHGFTLDSVEVGLERH